MAISSVIEGKRTAFIMGLEGGTMETFMNSTKWLPYMLFPLLERSLSVIRWFRLKFIYSFNSNNWEKSWGCQFEDKSKNLSLPPSKYDLLEGIHRSMPITWKQGTTWEAPQASVNKILSIEKAVKVEKMVSEKIPRVKKSRHKQEGLPFPSRAPPSQH